jgi:hypothetical protein
MHYSEAGSDSQIDDAAKTNDLAVASLTKKSLWFAKTPADREINSIAAAISTAFCYKS